MKMKVVLVMFFFWVLPTLAAEKLQVAGMTCEACAGTIRTALTQFPEVANVKIDVKKGQVEVEFKDAKTLTRAQIIQAIEKRGFKVKNNLDNGKSEG